MISFCFRAKKGVKSFIPQIGKDQQLLQGPLNWVSYLLKQEGARIGQDWATKPAYVTHTYSVFHSIV